MPSSHELFAEAQRCLVGGVNSPVRAYRAVGGQPPFIARAAGARIEDVEGKSYIDYVGTWGPAILGHAHPEVVTAIQKAAEQGTSFGAPTALEVEMASLLIEAVPSIERVRMVNSGTEATMAAVRLARGFTGRDKIIKLAGCYHGHADSLLVKAGSGVLTFGTPDSAGVPADVARSTIILPFNDAAAARRVFEAEGSSIAGLIIEPVAGNMGVIPPRDGYLAELREITRRHDALLIFDEVMTGFRVAYGGAQELYGVRPDLTCLGKIIGGGLPVGAFGGRRDIMEKLAPLGPVYQAGTLSGNPLAMTAGITTLRLLRRGGVYTQLEATSAALAEGLAAAAKDAGIPCQLTRVGSMLCCFFTAAPVRNYDEARQSDTKRFERFFRSMLGSGVYLAPSQFEAWFVSLAHSMDDIAATAAAARKALKGLR